MIQTKTYRKHLFTPLRYPGGKTSLFGFFDSVIKANGWQDVVYVEPYAGGAGAALSLLLLGKVNSIVINDLDPAIYAFWRSIINEPDAFIDSINTTPVTVAEWEKQKQIYKKADKNDCLRLGFATFFLNRTNRSGILKSAGPIGGKAQAGIWKIDARYNKEDLIAKIRLIAAHKSKIRVTRSNGIDVIERYSKNKNVFFYIDPPYFKKAPGLYLNAFDLGGHERLAKTLNSYPSLNWVLSYDNDEKIIDLYPQRYKEVFPLRYSAHHAAQGTELMIFSDAIDKRMLC